MDYAQNSHLTKTQDILKSVLIVLGVSGLLSLSAWVSIPLPFSPVPVSFTAQLVLLFAALLGRKGAYATCAYVAQGAMGLPVFAGGGFGIAYLLGPTGGYLIGFVIASYVVGVLSEQMKEKSAAKMFGIMLMGNALIYVFGLPHLALMIGGSNALKYGLYPFIAADVLKLMVAQRAFKRA